MLWRRFELGKYERGLRFANGEFKGALGEGVHWIFDPWRKTRVDVMSTRDAWIRNEDLILVVRSDVPVEGMKSVELGDGERGLVYVDGRFEAILEPGLYAFWTVLRDVVVEVVEVAAVGGARLVRRDLAAILSAVGYGGPLERVQVDAGSVGLYFADGELIETLGPGTYAFWRDVARVQVKQVSLREAALDIGGQEIMTADKVTLRLNAVVTYRVRDAAKAVAEVDDYVQALYREAQLALRAVIGTESLDHLLSQKEAVAAALGRIVSERGRAFGVEVLSVGIKDVILPGEMKELMNRVTEAKKAAEAALITRREETAAMRSQANTAKILEASPTLMRLRELEVLEKVADKANLTVVMGDGGLADQVMKML